MRRRPTKPLLVVVAGMIGGIPGQGGAAWAVLQYLLGLRRLGHEVFFVEPVSESHLRPTRVPIDRSRNSAYAAAVLDGCGFGGCWSLVERETRRTAGASFERLESLAQQADVFLNLGGTWRDGEVMDHIPVKIYVDLDPGFTQVWHQEDGIDMGFDGHTHFVTVGGAVGGPECPVPTCGRQWRPSVPPVVLDLWPQRSTSSFAGPVTTVANWRSYGSVRYDGRVWAQKAHSWRELIDLPGRSDERFEVALAIDDGDDSDVRALRANGWRLHDPATVASSPGSYQHFIAGSKAELCVAKSGYVESRSGWLSDRSVCYLASGRPVAAQDTGFRISRDRGLLTFTTVEQAAEALARINADYLHHSRAARALAEELFDSDRVLSTLLEAVGQ